MLFCSLAYAVFLPAVLALYWATPWAKGRVWLLLAASLYLYSCWNRWLALLIVATATLDYLAGLGLETIRSQGRRKLLLTLSLLVNFGVLIAFKYADFFLDSLEAALKSFGIPAALPALKWILPIGISFTTFEAVSYTVDVYRRKVRAERDWSRFVLFLTFFPHLVAGPIVRARDFLPQVGRAKRWSWPRAELGVGLFLLGLFKKMAIADRMAAYADPVFADPSLYSSGAAWIATVAYAIQIYCDFSGYTDMALGSAHLFGYKLAPNFRTPYLSTSVGEFWRRWHISLSTWLRDYLFIPLGGSRGTPGRTARNLLVTMTLGGLWHGARWTFVLWGLFHGVALVVHRGFHAWASVRPWIDGALRSAGGTVLRTAATFGFVCLGWVLFRATSLPDASAMLSRLLAPRIGLPCPVATGAFWTLLGVVALAHALSLRDRWPRLARRLSAPALGLSYALTLTLALLLAPAEANTFIYFNF